MELLLLRHGETEWNVSGRMQGLSDTQLTEAGLEQAREAVGRMPVFTEIWSSPLQRARDTAEIIAIRQDAGVRLDSRLIERSWGEWEGMLPDEVDVKWPGWRAAQRKPNGYEEDDIVFVRFQEWLTATSIQDMESPVLAVTHGGFMSAIERVLGGPDPGYKNLEGIWIGTVDDELAILRHEEFIPGARKLTR